MSVLLQKIFKTMIILIAVVTLLATTVYEAESLAWAGREHGKRGRLWAPRKVRLSRPFRLNAKLNKVMALVFVS